LKDRKGLFRPATPIPQVEETQEQTSKSKPKKGQRMIINASEIGNHCNHGWRAVFQFQDGRVQIEYDGEDEIS
jgi:hypothetical protein